MRRAPRLLMAVLVMGMAVLVMGALPAAASTPGRIVSLDMCMDWLLAYHLAPGRDVVFSPLYRQYPLPVARTGWPTHDGSLEQIYQLKPDLVLAGQYNAFMLRRRLRELGVRVAVVDLPQTFADVEQYERQVLALLELPETLATPAPPPVAPPADAPRLLLLGANGVGTGRGTFEDQLIRQAGWQNYLRHEGYAALDLEAVVMDPPDAIVWSAPDSRALANRFAEHPALKKSIPAHKWVETDSWRWECPGPWTWQLVEQLKQWKD